MSTRWIKIVGGAGLAAGAAAVSYPILFRGKCLNWGARPDEISRELPGDDLLTDADIVATRAITVDAPPGDIWPWLVQMGSGRGGAYILCLAACIQALGGSAPLASIALVYLTGSALGSAVPTPGGLGAVEAALSAGLTAAGLPGATAVSAVLLFRTLTFWLPVPVGWGAFNYLERHEYL